MPAEDSVLDPRLTAWVAVVAYYWQRRGVSDHDRDRLRLDLERDLRLALAEGASVEDLTGTDPHEFARELADADGSAPSPLRVDHPLTTTSLVVTALVGALAGAVVSAALLYPLGLWFLDTLSLSYYGQGVFTLGLHVVTSCVCAASAVAGVRWRFRFHEGIGRISLLTGLFLLLGGAASVAPTIALAATLGYSSAAPAMLLEVSIVIAFCVGGVRAAWWVLARDPRPGPKRTSARA